MFVLFFSSFIGYDNFPHPYFVWIYGNVINEHEHEHFHYILGHILTDLSAVL
jgi:hypothetical protein